MNPINIGVITTMLAFLFAGYVNLIRGNYIYGALFIFVGLCMNFFWRTVSSSSSSTYKISKESADETPWVLVVKILGRPKPYVVEHASLFLPPLVWFNKVPLMMVDHDFTLKKSFRTADGLLVSPTSQISVGVVADCADDPPDMVGAKTKGEKMLDYVFAIKSQDDIESFLDDTIIAWAEYVARHHSMRYLITHGNELSESLRSYIMGMQGYDPDTNSHIDDIRGLGLTISKINVRFDPPASWVKATEDRVKEIVESNADLNDTDTFLEQVKRLLVFDGYMNEDGDWIRGRKSPKIISEYNRRVMELRLAKSGKLSGVYNRGGLTVASLGDQNK